MTTRGEAGAARRAALFDLDRTLVRVETASLYVRFEREEGRARLADAARVAWWVAQYTLGVLDAPRVAERALSTLAGLPEAELAARCERMVTRHVERHLAEAGREAVERHRRDGAVVAIVTGATRYVAWPVARRLGIEHVVATELEVQPAIDDAGPRFTGRVAAPLCLGEGKLARARAFAERQGFSIDDAVFYTDSVTDLPLLLAVGEPVAVNPDPRLAREAARRGWRVERW